MDDSRYGRGKNPFARPQFHNSVAATGGTSNSLKGLIAGGVTGGIEVCFSYPTEFIKTKLQLDEKSGAAKEYTGFIDVFKKTVKEKGFFGLYRGLSVLLFFSIPKIGIRFGTFETLKGYALDASGNLSPMSRVLCGLGAGVSEAIFAVTPMETIKVKFIDDQRKKTPKFKGLINGIKTIVKEEGVKGCYKGLTATVLKQGSNQAIRFYVVETLKHEYRHGDPTVPIPKLIIGCFGVVAAIASVYANNPIDVVKTRMQGLEAKKYTSTYDCAVKVWKNEGLLAFYKGSQARLLRVGLDVGFSFMFYETIMELFDKIWH